MVKSGINLDGNIDAVTLACPSCKIVTARTIKEFLSKND